MSSPAQDAPSQHPTKPRVGAYQRISFDSDGDALGVERQRQDTHRLAELRGWIVVRDYTDNNLSAFKRGVVRPEFQRLLSDLRGGVIDGIVAYDLDRIARQPADLEALIDIYDSRRGLVFATTQNDIDLGGDGITMARVMIAFANKSSRDTARRVKRKIIEHATNGRPGGSPVRPYGYSADGMHLHAEEAAVLRDMGEWFRAGYSYYEIARRLNTAGRLTRAGSPWQPATIKGLLLRPRNAGFRVVDGVKYRGKWEHVFDEVEWDALERMRQHRLENRKGRPNNARYLLTRLVLCARCGAAMGGMTKRDDAEKPLRRTYQCKTVGCGMSVGAEPLEHLVREAVLYRLDGPALVEQLEQHAPDPHLADAFADVARLDARSEQLVTDYAEGLLSRQEFGQAKRHIQDRLQAIHADIARRQRRQLSVRIRAGQTLRAAWEENADGWRRELIEILIQSISISPATHRPWYDADGVKHRFSPDRVAIAWKA